MPQQKAFSEKLKAFVLTLAGMKLPNLAFFYTI
jgi:hypothetical protein